MIIFAAIERFSGDIATELLVQAATEESLAKFQKKFDLNRPVHERYFSWLAGAATGDFWISLANQRPVCEIIFQRTANTFFLGCYAAAISVPIAVVSGMMAALYNGSIFDRAHSSTTLAAISFPEFFIAYILILVFSVGLGWLASVTNVDVDTGLGERLYTTFLTAMTLTLIVLAHMMRMTRAAILNLLAMPYLEMAHLKGIKR